MKTQSIVVWRAKLDGECYEISQSEDQLWDNLRNYNWRYEGTTDDQWEITSSTEELPLVTGSSKDHGYHIWWKCPHCNKVHLTDREDFTSPALWFCERGEGMCLVDWQL